MTTWIPWARVGLSAQLPVEEVQRRLAELTADWVATGWATPVPPPPWRSDAFVAILGAPFVSSTLERACQTKEAPIASGPSVSARLR